MAATSKAPMANRKACALPEGSERHGGSSQSRRQAQGRCAPIWKPWHADIEEFLELRKNTGDDRRRTHDMNTANWIPDLFMKRVMEGGDWTLFSPSEVPDLHDLYGAPLKKPMCATKPRRARRAARVQKLPGAQPVAQDPDHAVLKPAARGSPSKTRAISAARSNTSAWCTAPTCARKSPEHQRQRDCRVQSGLGELVNHLHNGQLDQNNWPAPCAPPCACWTTSSTSTSTR